MTHNSVFIRIRSGGTFTALMTGHPRRLLLGVYVHLNQLEAPGMSERFNDAPKARLSRAILPVRPGLLFAYQLH